MSDGKQRILQESRSASWGQRPTHSGTIHIQPRPTTCSMRGPGPTRFMKTHPGRRGARVQTSTSAMIQHYRTAWRTCRWETEKTQILFAYGPPSPARISASQWLTKGAKRGWAGAPGSTVRTPSVCAYSPPTIRSCQWLQFFLSLYEPH